MKNLTTILIIITVIAVLIYLRNDDNSSPVFSDESGVIRGMLSINDIVKLNKSLNCTFRKTDGKSNVTGSIIVFENMIRGDLDIETEILDQPITSHFIIRENVTYSWTSLINVGYESLTFNQIGIVDLDDKIECICQSWNADLTRFKLPSGINFRKF